MAETSIEWTRGDDGTPGKTWNPFRGCRKISPGCKHCYAETFAERFRGVAGHPYERGFDPRVAWDALTKPLGWRKPTRIFVNSMSDLFLEDFSDDEIDRVFGVMWACLYIRDAIPGHVFQILTKRAERMLDYMSQDRRKKWASYAVTCGGGKNPDGMWDQVVFHEGPHPRIWLGVSVESQPYANSRIPLLRKTPAAVRFLSIEPMLEDIDLIGNTEDGQYGPIWDLRHVEHRSEYGTGVEHDVDARVGIDWVIVGGESGPSSRRFAIDWARSIVRQCKTLDVPVFVKQLGRLVVSEEKPNGNFRTHEGKRQFEMRVTRLPLLHKKGGDPAEWPEDLRIREFPEARP